MVNENINKYKIYIQMALKDSNTNIQKASKSALHSKLN
jgi:hypothetical protein